MPKGPQPLTWQQFAAEFWTHVNCPNEPGVCWPWKGSIGGPGYGQITARGIQKGPITAHTMAYRLTFGPLPKTDRLGRRLEVMHTCDHKWCCRPAHLRLGIHRRNMRDAIDRGLLKLGGRTKSTWRKGDSRWTRHKVVDNCRVTCEDKGEEIDMTTATAPRTSSELRWIVADMLVEQSHLHTIRNLSNAEYNRRQRAGYRVSTLSQAHIDARLFEAVSDLARLAEAVDLSNLQGDSTRVVREGPEYQAGLAVARSLANTWQQIPSDEGRVAFMTALGGWTKAAGAAFDAVVSDPRTRQLFRASSDIQLAKRG